MHRKSGKKVVVCSRTRIFYSLLMISPHSTERPHSTQDIPHIYHDIPHGTEHPHGIAHTLCRVVKTNKMIHKKTGAFFLVVYVIYVSHVYTDSKRTVSCLLPRHTIFATFERQLKCLIVRIQGGLYLFHYVLDNLNWLLFVFLSIFMINLMYNIEKLYFNDQHTFRV